MIGRLLSTADRPDGNAPCALFLMAGAGHH